MLRRRLQSAIASSRDRERAEKEAREYVVAMQSEIATKQGSLERAARKVEIFRSERNAARHVGKVALAALRLEIPPVPQAPQSSNWLKNLLRVFRRTKRREHPLPVMF